MNLQDYTGMIPGEKLPVTHCNPRKKSAVVFRSADKVTLYCSRCGHTETLRVQPRIYSLLPSFLRKTSEVLQIPPDCSDWAETGDQFRYCISKGLYVIPDLKFSKIMDRFVLPVYSIRDFQHTKEPIGAQLRAWKPEQKVKYLTVNGQNLSGYIAECCDPKDQHVIFTEDIASAEAVTQRGDGILGVALLGTHPSPGHLNNLLDVLTPVARRFSIWLDPDQPGQQAALELRRKLGVFGLLPNVIHSATDPKFCTEREIKQRTA